MLAKERQDTIANMLKSTGAVTTANLTECFKVSTETIRRDLLYMENQGILVRVHGGAVSKGDMKLFKELKERNKESLEQKHELSLKAVEFISEGDIIAVDAGSTAISFVKVLKEKFSRLTVVTHCVDVFDMLCNYKDFSVIVCGGHYLREENAFCGELTINMLSNIHVQKAFVFPSAISIESGIYDYQKDLFQIQKQIMKSADNIYILADSSKFEKTGLLKLSDMQSNFVYVSDSLLKSQIVRIYKENDIKIYLGGIK